MARMKRSCWLAVLSLEIALASSIASILEADTLSIGGTFHMDQLTGTVGADLAEVFAHQNEHTWSLTLFGVTQSLSYEYIDDSFREEEHYITRVHATSFEFGFVGPDADVLNGVISQQLTTSSLGDDLFLELRNYYSYGGLNPGSASWALGLLPLDDAAGIAFFAGAGYRDLDGFWFPATQYFVHPYGFPLVEPQTIRSHRTSIHDSRSGNSGNLVSTIDFVEIDLFPQFLSGDYSGNGTVGPEDYDLWKASYGSTMNLAADGNGDGQVNAADYTVWRNNLGASLGAGSGVTLPSATPLSPAVPEPATVVLFGVGLVGLGVALRCRVRGEMTAGNDVTQWNR